MLTAGVAPCPSSPRCVPPGHTSMPLSLHPRRLLCTSLQLINLQEAESKTHQWKMRAGTKRGASSPGHQQTARVHLAAVNLQPHANQLPLPRACPHQAGVKVHVLQGHLTAH